MGLAHEGRRTALLSSSVAYEGADRWLLAAS